MSRELLVQYQEENMLTDREMAEYLDITVAQLLAYFKTGNSAIVEKNMKSILFYEDDETDSFYLPDWVKQLHQEIRPYIEQEYYVNPEIAVKMAETCKTVSDIKEFRMERWKAEITLTGSSLADISVLPLEFTIEN